MNYYDPLEVGIDDLVKRIRIGKDAKEFLNTILALNTLNFSQIDINNLLSIVGK